jgi:(p)ppGpp synthase/HD superfamily hydrolase
MKELTKIAKDLSFRLHNGQFYDQNKNIPYEFHINQVVDLVSNYGFIAEMIAYLHDTIEDTKITEHSLESKLVVLMYELNIDILSPYIKSISRKIAHAVYLLSDEDGENRKERKIKTNYKLLTISDDFLVVLIVKISDRIANMQYSYDNDNEPKMKMYFKEFEEFRKAVYRNNLPSILLYKLDKIYEDTRIKLNK